MASSSVCQVAAHFRAERGITRNRRVERTPALVHQRPTTQRRSRSARKSAAAVVAAEASTEISQVEDKWVAGSLERCVADAGSDKIAALRQQGMAQLKQARMPSTRVEEYRFTDLAPLLKAEPVKPDADVDIDTTGFTLESADATRIVLVDGVFSPEKSDLSGVPSGITVGMLSQLDDVSAAAIEALGAQSMVRGNVFAGLNSALSTDVAVVHVPAGKKLDAPVHIIQVSSNVPGDGLASSAPRCLVVVGEGAEVSVVEEFGAGVADGKYWHNGVCEIVIAKDARVNHTMVQSQSRGAVHTRATYVSQEESSAYSLAEVTVGSKVSRHDLDIVQLGPRTETELACFNLAGEGQLVDLHSKIRLDFEEGTTDQLHKCIVSHATGRGVFDGNVQVNQMAQRTDAGQLSKNLLLVPKATVNVKPNLQIIADDVVCTHGCTVADLEEEELFYIQSRGVDPDTARALLVAGFGLQIVSRLSAKDLRERVGGLIRDSLKRDAAQLGV